MPISLSVKKDRLVAFLSGEIDHHSAKEIRSEIDISIAKNAPSLLEMDFSGVSFMDSSGIGLVMGRCKSMNACGGRVIVKNVSPEIQKVMLLSGLDRIVTISNSSLQKGV